MKLCTNLYYILFGLWLACKASAEEEHDSKLRGL